MSEFKMQEELKAAIVEIESEIEDIISVVPGAVIRGDVIVVRLYLEDVLAYRKLLCKKDNALKLARLGMIRAGFRDWHKRGAVKSA